MANITISELRPAGSDLFLSSESFLDELTGQQVSNVLGGDVVLIFTLVCWGDF